jgi:WD40 repeat protein
VEVRFARAVAAAAVRPFRRLGGSSGPAAGSSYRAFISYSHAADGRLAPAMQLALHRFARPWYRLRAIRVFRDDASLSANPALWSSITEALDGSDFFLLLASPEAAESSWVDRELAYWCERRPRSNVLVALTDGELSWDSAAGDFDWRHTTALPPAARGKFEGEPRWIDLRWARTRDDLSLHNARFREAIADLAAPLHGRPKDELVGEDVRQHRRTIRIAAAATLALAALTVVAAGAAVIALRERDAAIQKSNIASSRALASEALQNIETRLDVSTLLSLIAYRTDPTAEARNALATTLQQSVGVRFLPVGQPGVPSFAFSPNGHMLALGRDDGTIVLWDLVAHRAVRNPLVTHDGPILGVAFSLDGKTLASAGQATGTIRIWDLATFEPIGRPLHSGLTVPDSVALTSSLVAVGGEVEHGSGEEPSTAQIEFWRVGSGMRAGVVQAPDLVTVLAFAPDGRHLASLDLAGGLTLWDAVEHKSLGRIAVRQFSAAGLSHDGTTVALGANDRTITLWDVATRKQLGPPLRGAGVPSSVAFNADDSIVVAGDEQGRVRLWNVRTRKPIGTPFTFMGGRVTAVGFGSDGRPLAAAYLGDRTTTIALLDVKRSFATLLLRRAGFVTDVALSPDGGTLALRGNDGTVSIWDVAKRRPTDTTLSTRAGIVWSVAVSSDRRAFATGGPDGAVRLWTVDGSRAPRLLGRFPEAVLRVSFSDDGKTLVSESFSRARLWDVDTGKPLEGPPDRSISAAAFSPDGRTLALGHDGGTVRLWDIAGHRLKAAQAGDGNTVVEGMAFSPDGTIVASAVNPTPVVLWDVARGRTQRLHGGRSGALSNVAFSPDGKTLAVGDSGGTINLWDVTAGKQLGAPLQVEGSVSDLAFARDGKSLVAISSTNDGGFSVVAWDGILWSRDFDELQKRVCGITARSLTRGEWADFAAAERYRETCHGTNVSGSSQTRN